MVNSIITYLITTLLGSIIGYLGNRVKNFKKREEDIKVREENQKTTLQALLRNAITTKYYIYIQIGSIPSWERENLIHLYEEYQKQGGNSYVQIIMQELLALPIDDTLHEFNFLTTGE